MKEIGKLGEKVIENYFLKRGHQIINKNIWLKKFGEIDLITKKDNVFYFVEVKSLKENEYFLPEIHYNNRKKEKFHKLINYFVNKYGIQEYKSLLATVRIGKKIKIKIYENV